MIIGYLYLYKHNPNINWQKGQWKFTRCPDICTSKVRKIQDIKVGANELHLKMDISRFLSLDNIGDENPNERVQKEIAYWNKQNKDMPAPNCMLKV